MNNKLDQNGFFGSTLSNEKSVTPKSLMKILENDASEIESIKFIAPRINSDDFGHFKVRWEFPQYGVKNAR